MEIVFRADASLTMGTGHVMRCLTLANALRERDAKVSFVCREHDGHLCKLVEDQGFHVSRLSMLESGVRGENILAHASWLGASWQEDAKQTRAAIETSGAKPDWLVVDHYALDHRWEIPMRPLVRRIMAIDDLADRKHDCDLLLDQNLLAQMLTRYVGKVPPGCSLLLGSDYALLQPVYAELHDRTSPRAGPIRRVFVFFGGADRDNLTGRTLAAFLQLNRPDIEVDVVIAASSPHAEAIRLQAMKYGNIHLHSGLPTLAHLMVNADLAVGAGGATSWERLCLGLPAIVLTLAANQVPVAAYLQEEGLVHWLGQKEKVDQQAIADALARTLEKKSLMDWSNRCRQVCDGRGVSRVLRSMTGTD